jgi:hypothetical protein
MQLQCTTDSFIDMIAVVFKHHNHCRSLMLIALKVTLYSNRESKCIIVTQIYCEYGVPHFNDNALCSLKGPNFNGPLSYPRKQSCHGTRYAL